MRRRVLSKVGLATLLGTAALAFSGCWGTVYGPSGGHQLLVVPGNISDRIIFGCGGSRICTLDTFRAFCGGVPLPNLSYGNCYAITWVDHYYDIGWAILEVTSPHADCLAAHINKPGTYPYDWFALPLGAYGCTR